ncbi:flavodoxin family protein [Candidatus Electronema sp. TJ]|uniref:flavodoxin family protein n=1 Tax=Candidatus Electronema sp. TJ TaxID=3401573 RepID=UPI003AA8EFFF
MSGSPAQSKRILVLYYSFSSQTKNLVQSLLDGMAEYEAEVVCERLVPTIPQHFPIGTIPKTVKKMIVTLFRQRIPIEPLPERCFEQYDLIILAGPTWSYNPSGPVLSLLDRDGQRLFAQKTVIPVISCRGFWRMHWWGIKSLLKNLGARVPNGIIFTHTSKEPWRTVGVFLKLAGETPERMSWMQDHYPKYGHTREQIAEARRFGEQIGRAVTQNEELERLVFNTSLAIYEERSGN